MLVYDHCMFSSSRFKIPYVSTSQFNEVSVPPEPSMEVILTKMDSGFWKPKFTRATLLCRLIRYFKPLQFVVNIASG